MRNFLAAVLLVALALPAEADVVDSGSLIIGQQGIIGGTMTVQGNAFSVGGSVSASSATLTATGSTIYSLTTSSSIHLLAGGLRWADGTLSTTASQSSGTGLASSSATTNMTSTRFTGPALLGACVTGSTITLTSSGANVAVWFTGTWQTDSYYFTRLGFLVDGQIPTGLTNDLGVITGTPITLNNPTPISFYFATQVTAGSHTYCLTASSKGTGPLLDVPAPTNQITTLSQFGVMELK